MNSANSEIDFVAMMPKYILDSIGEVSEKEIVHYIAVLEEIARLGGISVVEENFEQRVAVSLGCTAELVAKARKLVRDDSPSMGELEVGEKNLGLKVCLLRDAYILAMIDDKVDRTEWLALERLVGALGISEHLAKQVMTVVDAQVKLQKQFKEEQGN